MTKITPHFTLEELAGTSHEDLRQANLFAAAHDPLVLARLTLLAYDLEAARTEAFEGAAVRVHCAFRFPELNKRVGGVETSDHLSGGAVDFSLVSPTWGPEELEAAYSKLSAWLRRSGRMWGQAIKEQSGSRCWIHYSTGWPFRPLAKCRQFLTFDGKSYTMTGQLDVKDWS